MFAFLHNSYVESLMSKVTVVGGGAFVSWLDREWDWCLYEKDPTEIPCPSHHVKIQWEVSDPKEDPHLRILVSCSQTSTFQNSEKQISVVFKLLSLWNFVIAALMD